MTAQADKALDWRRCFLSLAGGEGSEENAAAAETLVEQGAESRDKDAAEEEEEDGQDSAEDDRLAASPDVRLRRSDLQRICLARDMLKSDLVYCFFDTDLGGLSFGGKKTY